jgi:UDP-glucose 6-dehydrogenase
LAIVGAGYVGVTAACAAHLGHDMVALDVDVERSALRAGAVYLRTGLG